MEGLVLKLKAVNNKIESLEAPRGGAGIEISSVSTYVLPSLEAPRGGAGIEISSYRQC